MVDFSKLLDVSCDEIKAPPALPAGTYYGSITGHKFDESAKNKTPFCRVTVKFESASAEIDPSDLEGIELTKKTMNKDYWLTPDSLYRFRDMLQSIGLHTDGRKLDEVVPEMNNMPCMIEVTQRPGDTPEDPPRNDIKSIAGIAE